MNYYYPGINSFSNEAMNEMNALYMRMKPGSRIRENHLDESFLNISSAPGSLMRGSNEGYVKEKLDDFMAENDRQNFTESSRIRSLGQLPMFQGNRQDMVNEEMGMSMGFLRSSQNTSNSSLYYDFSSAHNLPNGSSAFESFSSSSSQIEMFTASGGDDDSNYCGSNVQSENESFSRKSQSSKLSSEEDVDADVEVDGDNKSETTSELGESAGEYCKGGYHPVCVGDIFCNRYHVLRKLGYGHFSTVWMCWDAKEQRYCAAKIIKSASHFSETARDEIRLFDCITQAGDPNQEAGRNSNRAKKNLYSKRVISLLDTFKVSGVNGTHYCLIFEALGDNLLTLIQRTNYRGLPLNNVKQIARQMLEGLDFLHSRCDIIHTDLKPENVLLVLDDLQLRTQANEAAGKYIYFHKVCMANRRKRNSFVQKQNHQYSSSTENESQPGLVHHEKLSKSQKKRLRAKIKRNINFFQAHREYLRDKGIEDLLKMAKSGSLDPMTVAAAVTNQLSFMSFDDMEILSDDDLDQLYRLKYVELEEQNDKMAQGLRAQNDAFYCNAQQSPLFFQNSENMQHILAECSDKLKLLLTSPEDFLHYVQDCIAKQSNDKSDNFHNKRSNRKHKDQSTGKRRKNGCNVSNASDPLASTKNLSRISSSLQIPSNKDPALQTCKLNIKIADIGNGCWRFHHFTDDIQTREYRAIEVILGAGYDTSADIWSAGCLFWELATGDYLFDPQYQRAANQDETHVANIIELCGPIPRDLIIHGEYSGDVFTINGKLKNIKTLRDRDLTQILINGYLWNPDRAREFTEFLRPFLNVNPKKRVSASAALTHEWLKIKDDQTKYFRS